jgi:hypothetical protein
MGRSLWKRSKTVGLDGLRALSNLRCADPTYRGISLLYIGLAGRSANSTFEVRVPQDHKCYWGTGNHKRVCVYVGRLMGLQTPENAVWTKEIELAESLLIHAHYPPYNTQKDGAASRPEFPSLRVFNWGDYRDLFQEVSGERLGSMPPMRTNGDGPPSS